MRHRSRQLAALAVTIVVLAGIPYLLTTLLTWPAVDLSWLTIQVYLQSGRLPPGVGMAALMVALWAVWAAHSLAVAVEALAWMRGHRLRLRPLGPLQVLAATALGATLTTTSAAHAAAPAPLAAEGTKPDQHAPNSPQASASEQPTPTLANRSRTIDGFDYDDVALTQPMKNDLAPTIQLIARRHATDTPVAITGHTDPQGDASYNQALSQRRAEAVADYLRSQLGDDAPRLETRGRGEDAPVAGDDAQQRRVEITYTITRTSPPTPQKHTDTDPASPQAEPTTERTSDQETDQQAIALVLPSGITVSLTAAGAAAAGAAGGYTLAARRRPRHPREATTGEGRPAPHPVPTGPTDAGPSRQMRSRQPGPAAADDADNSRDVIEEPLLLELLNTPGVGITGPGAAGAARCLIATALRRGEGSRVRIVMGADETARLLDDDARAALAQRRDPTIETVDTPHQAMALLHSEMIERQFRLNEAEVETVAELRSSHGQGPALEPLVLIISPPEDADADAAELLRSAAELDITAVILGPWQAEATLTITTEGTITDTPPALSRLQGAHWPVLSSQALTRMTEALPPTAPAPDSHGEHASTSPAAQHSPDTDGGIDQATTPSTSTPQPRPTPEDVPPDPDPDAAASPTTAQAPGQATGTQDQALVRLRLLGRVQITVAGQQVRLRRGHGFEVAAYLAVHPDGARRDTAIEDMWPGEELRRTTRRFNDAISSLRRVGGEHCPPVVTRTGDIYRLANDLIEVDIWKLQAALQAAETTTDAAQRQEHLQRALDLYTADLAAESDYHWITPTRTAVRQRTARAVCDHAEQLNDAQPVTAAALVHRAVDLDPTNEELHATAVRLHLHHGDTAAARRAQQRCIDELAQIHTDPSPHVLNLLDNLPHPQ